MLLISAFNADSETEAILARPVVAAWLLFKCIPKFKVDIAVLAAVFVAGIRRAERRTEVKVDIGAWVW